MAECNDIKFCQLWVFGFGLSYHVPIHHNIYLELPILVEYDFSRGFRFGFGFGFGFWVRVGLKCHHR